MRLIIICLLLALTTCCSALDLSKVKMYSQFTITQYSPQNIPRARSLTQSKNDPKITYVGTSGSDTIYALIDQGAGKQAVMKPAINGFNNAPGGVEWYQGSLFVAEKNTIYRFDNIDTKFTNGVINKNQAAVTSQYYGNWTLNDAHSLKGAMAIRDGKIYLPIGSPCNHPKVAGGAAVGHCQDPDFGKIITMSTTTLKVLEVVASGHRNSVGMDFSPKTGELWFTDNGRDEWALPGNDSSRFMRPSDELNRMSKTGLNFGFPNCYGSGLTWASGGADEQYDWAGKDCRAANSPYTNSEWDVGAHTASLGMQFLSPTSTWPEKFQGSILIAQHGCWNCEGGNRGYQVIAVHLDPTGTKAIGQTTIADFRTYVNQQPNGRPVDVQNMADGSILMSDDSDQGNAVFRIAYTGPPYVAPTTPPVTQAPTQAATPPPTKAATPAPTQAATSRPATSAPTPEFIDPFGTANPTPPIFIVPGNDGSSTGTVSTPTDDPVQILDPETTTSPITTSKPTTTTPTGSIPLGTGSGSIGEATNTLPSVVTIAVVLLVAMLA